jgi:hypothetical protein
MNEQVIGVQRARLPFTILENAPFEDRALSKTDLMSTGRCATTLTGPVEAGLPWQGYARKRASAGEA